MADFPTFEAFYRAVNGRDPFPWQRRLAEQVRKTGWPEGVGVGTGLGKTSSLDVAVWTMAADHVVAPRERTSPTRVWYVVNRRLLVDAAFAHGRRIGRLLADPAAVDGTQAREILRAVADGLAVRQGGAAGEPLHVCRLRGGAELGARPPDPAQPALVFATVDMFASRWLFRGFGTSAGMRSVDAALAGIDSLVLLDEAHLARPLAELVEPIAQCDLGDASAILPATRCRPVLVNMTATGDGNAFVLDADDEADPLVRKRLDAAKPVALVKTTRKKLAAALAEQAVARLASRGPSAAVVFCNAPSTARAVMRELEGARIRRRDPLDADLVLLTGRMREREAASVRDTILDTVAGAPAGRNRPSKRSRHLVVVATQTLEVGADVDFDLLVTEACGARALIQRLGRLNRLGEIDDAAGAVVLPEGETDFGIYGDEPLALWKRLEARAANATIDMSPRAVAEIVGPPGDRPSRAGEVLPAHLWEWAKTTTPPVGEAPPELFYGGLDTDIAEVSILWRAVLPGNGEELVPPAGADESVDVPIGQARTALSELLGGTICRLGVDRVTVEHDVALSRLRPGDVVVVPADAGGYDGFGWAPEARESVLDLSLLRRPGPLLLPAALEQLFAGGEELAEAERLAKLVAAPPELDEDLDRQALVSELLAHLRQAGRSAIITDAESEILSRRLTGSVIYLPGDGAGRLELRREPSTEQQAELRSDVFDELSFTATSASLSDHLGAVGELAGRIAEHLGIPPVLREAVAAAGRFHDLGKADHRFQRWLHPAGQAPEPVAKSSTSRERWRRDRVAAGWPAGGRHEELSRRLLEAWLATHEPPWDPDLVLHLVVSHHGSGRPLVEGVHDGLPVALSSLVDGDSADASGDLSTVDWGQPARFRRCCESYGYWGLALLEAIVRQADHQVSKVVVA